MGRQAATFTVAAVARAVTGAARAAEKEGLPFLVEIDPRSGKIIIRQDDADKKGSSWDDI